MNNDWWLKYLPTALESMEVYLKRITGQEEMEFAMMEVTSEELDVIAASYEIMQPRFSFERGLYAVLVIRDLVFLTYTKGWSNASN
jgi:hypothetical protein